MSRRLFTSECVTEGHPDKVCDQISDAVLDDILKNDKNARVACEVCTATGLVVVFGEITTTHYADIQNIVRETVKKIGYTDPDMGFHYENCAVLNSLHEQSADIALGVDIGGAGDQGMMFGYATDETDEYMPLAMNLSQRLALKLADVRKRGELTYIRPDGKTQVTVEYDGDTPIRVDTVLISTQHKDDVTLEKIKTDVINKIIIPTIPKNLIDASTKFLINPTGRFVIGGPHGDSGLTGRKIIADTYGGSAPHGGGAFSGKDPTKVDRSASYMARYIAKNIVAAGLAKKCQIQLAYAIGVKEPVSVNIDTFNTSKYSNEVLEKMVKEKFDLTPNGIIERLDLLRPIYFESASYGHFGRSDKNFPWEKLDAVNELA